MDCSSRWLVEGRFARGESRSALMNEAAAGIKPLAWRSWRSICCLAPKVSAPPDPRFREGEETPLAQRLDHQPVTVAMRDRFVARQFELHRDANRLIATVAKQSDVPLLTHGKPPSICLRHLPLHARGQGRTSRHAR